MRLDIVRPSSVAKLGFREFLPWDFRWFTFGLCRGFRVSKKGKPLTQARSGTSAAKARFTHRLKPRHACTRPKLVRARPRLDHTGLKLAHARPTGSHWPQTGPTLAPYACQTGVRLEAKEAKEAQSQGEGRFWAPSTEFQYPISRPRRLSTCSCGKTARTARVPRAFTSTTETRTLGKAWGRIEKPWEA